MTEEEVVLEDELLEEDLIEEEDDLGEESDIEETKSEEPVKKAGGRPKGSKNKPKKKAVGRPKNPDISLLAPSAQAAYKRKKQKEKEERLKELKEIESSMFLREFKEQPPKSRFRTLHLMGIGVDTFYCHKCGEIKDRKDFYSSSSELNKAGATYICKECASKVANRVNAYGEPEGATKESIMQALEMLDKPFIESVFDASVTSSTQYEEDITAGRETCVGPSERTIWTAYMKNVSMIQWQHLRWRDGDYFRRMYKSLEIGRPSDIIAEEHKKTAQTNTDEIANAYALNKRDVIKFVGYDPFANYPREEEKPLLYASLCSYLDEETKNDGNKKNAVIQIVKKFNQAEKLDDQIDMYINDTLNAANNMGLINKMADTSSKLVDIANKLAKDNGVSVNHNNNKSKGANTLSGKIKKLDEIGFEDAKINCFDIGSCEGMMQVALISEQARHAQIGYDENIAQEIKDIKVELVESLTKERDIEKERARLLILENKALKKFLQSKGLIDENFNIIEEDPSGL